MHLNPADDDDSLCAALQLHITSTSADAISCSAIAGDAAEGRELKPLAPTLLKSQTERLQREYGRTVTSLLHFLLTSIPDLSPSLP